MSLQRGKALKRTPMRRRWRDTGPSDETKALLEVRSRGRCELCVSAPAVHTHHRSPRGMGSTRDPKVNLPSSLLRLCSDCHTYVEGHRAEALIAGWLVSRYSDPARTAVLLGNASFWTYLTDDGRYSENPPCTERWGDEIGCDDGQPWHHCAKETLGGRKHECRCGAYVLEDAS